MKKVLSLFIILTLALLCGCVSSNEKAVISSGIDEYFSFLKSKNYDNANSMVYDADETGGIESRISENSLNDFIFDKISYDVWSITEKDGIYYADLVIKQLSLRSAYGSAAEEFSEYIKEAEKSGKSYSQYALDEAFDKILYENLKNEEEYLTLKCTVPCRIVDGIFSIGMTSEFRNCLFGGELDAINAINNL